MPIFSAFEGFCSSCTEKCELLPELNNIPSKVGTSSLGSLTYPMQYESRGIPRSLQSTLISYVECAMENLSMS